MAPSPVEALCVDLVDERADLDAMLDGLQPERWHAPTPAEGWTVLDQITHLAWFDQATQTTITDPDGFRAERAAVVDDLDGFVDRIREQHDQLTGSAARSWLRDAGDALVRAARAADPSVRLPWYGPDMTLASALTARLMETWAHGQDVADALDIERTPTDRLRHVAFIGWRALANSFRANDLQPPDAPVRVSLVAPDGQIWQLGPPEAEQAVVGPALDFCLLVTQRRHRSDTALVATGDVADRWLDIAQAFAGPPGTGRAPLTRRLS